MLVEKMQKYLPALGIVLLLEMTIIIRLVGMGTLYDVHIDEITYIHFAQTIQAGHFPLLFSGAPFFLHPPGYFALLALWRSIVWHGQDIFWQYTALRGLNVVLAGVTVGLIFGLAKIITKGNRLALVAGLLFAIDPLAIRNNSRALIDTSAVAWMMLGLWLLFSYMNKTTVKWWYWAGTGLAFGMGIVTKDVVAVFMVLMFGIMAILRIGPPKKAFLYLVPAAILPYAVWFTIVAVNGYKQQFFNEKTVGLRRFIGILQLTGFNSKGAPSKGGTILTTLVQYLPSYIIIGLGAAGAILLLTSKNENRRRWGSVAAASTLLLGYIYAIGTLEEQSLYYLLVPSTITIMVAAYELWIRAAKYRNLIFRGTLAAVAALAFYGSAALSVALSQPDKGWFSTVQWVDANAPSGSTIVVFGQGQFLFPNEPYIFSDAESLSQMQAAHVKYVINSRKLIAGGYVPISASEMKQVYAAGKIVFSYHSRDSGIFDVIQLPVAKSLPATPAGQKAVVK